MKRKILIMMLLLVMLASGCGKNNSENSGYVVKKSSDIVDVILFESITTEGESISSEIFNNSKITMINVWATYCNPCLNEMPDLGEIAADYNETEFQVLGIVSDVSVKSSSNDIEYVNELIEETKADYPHLLLSESLYSNLVSNVDAVPTTFFVNQDGEILKYVVGANSKNAWEKIIDELLEEIG